MPLPPRLRAVSALLAALALGWAVACSSGGVRKQREDPDVEPACGDGAVDQGEDCDGSNLGPNSCTSLGFDLGSLSCTAECAFDTSKCVKLCGDGKLGPGEVCDGTVGPLSCPDFGYKTCTDTCQVDALTCKATAFDVLPHIELNPGGPAVLTDLAPETFGDLAFAVEGRTRMETFDYDLTRGFEPDRKVTNLDQAPVLPLSADVDGDGHQDLASINDDGSADRYRFAQGSFVQEALHAPMAASDGGVGACPASLWLGAADLDGEGPIDLAALACPLATGGPGWSHVLVFPGGTGPQPARQVVVGATIAAGALADLDGDGAEEVLLATSDAKLVALRGKDLTADPPRDLPAAATALAAGDLDGDGDADLVLRVASGIQVLENTGNGFADRGGGPGSPASLLVRDLDLDGLVDFAFAEDGEVQVRRSLGAFTFTSFSVATGAGAPLSLSAGDLEADGDPDLAVTAQGAGTATTTWVLRNRVR